MKRIRQLVTTFLVASLLWSTVACGPPPEGMDPGAGEGEEQPSEEDGETPDEPKAGERVYIVEGGIPDPATFIANQHSEAGTGDFGNFAYEGLIRYQRGSDDIALQLAESYYNEGDKTIFKLRKNVKYNDGAPFTAKDIWAFYAINPNTPVQYLKSVEATDDYTVEFTWQDPVPTENMRIMLIAREIHHARCPYHIYGEYADKLSELWQKLPDLTEEQKQQGVTAPWGKDRAADPETAEQIDVIYKDYTHHKEPENYVIGTGPYVNVLGHTMNEASMVPNKHYWNKDIELFDRIIIKRTTDASKANMMIAEDIHWMNGTMPKDLSDKVLASNENIVFYPMEDAACMGVYFNTQSKTSPMDKKEFRQALNYIVDRHSLRDIGSYQSELNPWSTTVIPPSMLEKYVRPEVMDKMRRYEEDHDKAVELLESIGCEKRGDRWVDADGKRITMKIGIDKNNMVAMMVAPVLANQFTMFGMHTTVNAVDGSVYGTQADTEHVFDMSWDFMNIAWTFSYPYFPLTDFYSGTAGYYKKMNLPFDEARSLATLELEDWEGNTFNPWEETQAILRDQDEEVSQARWEKMIWAANENAFGINFFQNVTGSWENLKAVDNLPMLEKLPEDRWMPLPETDLEKILVQNLNVGFSSYIRKMSMLQPPGEGEPDSDFAYNGGGAPDVGEEAEVEASDETETEGDKP